MTTDSGARRIDTGGGAVVEGGLRVGRDFIGRDQLNQYYQFVTVVYTSLPGRDVELATTRVPFVADRPFTRDEPSLFTGREDAISRIQEYLDDPQQRAVVVCGPAGVGKTSLLSAGVVPLLDPVRANPPIPLRDYGHASPFLRVELYRRATAQGLDVPEDTSVPELVARITRASSQRLVLILDQFERFFQPDVSEPEREALRADLAQTVARIEPNRFQIIIAIRDDARSELDRQWDDLFPGLRQARVPLVPLRRKQAKDAILQPIQTLLTQPVFDDTFVDRQLLVDLDRLSGPGKDHILPADLQVVCSELFLTARREYKQFIDTDFYSASTDGKGAEQIIDLRFDRLMLQVNEERRELARQIATEMLDRGPQVWLAADQLPGAGPIETQATLDEMHTAGITIWHVSAGESPAQAAPLRRAYSLASDSIARAAERALGHDAQKRRQARQELEYVWQDWVVEDSWASKYQVNLLQRNYADGPPPPERALLLLGSAVARQTPVDHWLEQLNTDATRGLIRDLEGGQAQASQGKVTSAQLTPRSQASRILALSDNEDLPPRPAIQPALRSSATEDDQPPSPDFGPVAWSAAAHRKKAICRETAVLALLAAYSPEALAQDGPDGLSRYGPDVLTRVKTAVLTGRLGRRRLNELHGILADADPDVAVRLRTRPLPERLGVWWWRFRRRFVRDLPYIGSLTLGGAVGAGLGLGLLRAVLAPLVQERPGYAFYAAFAVAFLFGLAVSLGLLLVNALRLQPPEHGPKATGRRPLLPAVVLGTLCFAAMHVVHGLLFGTRGFVAAALTSALALSAGMGLSLAVYDQPFAGARTPAGRPRHAGAVAGRLPRARRWLPRLAVAAVALALVQAVFAFGLNPEYGTGLVFAWTGYYYQSGLSDTLVRWGLGGVLAIPDWFHYVAVIDAGLTGISLAAGLAVGLNVARRWFDRWEALAIRAGE